MVSLSRGEETMGSVIIREHYVQPTGVNRYFAPGLAHQSEGVPLGMALRLIPPCHKDPNPHAW